MPPAALLCTAWPLAAGQPVKKQASAPWSVVASDGPGFSRVMLTDGRVIHETSAAVRDVSITRVNTGEAVVRWYEADESGTWIPWYSLTRDAASTAPSFESPRHTSDRLLLKYAQFDPLQAEGSVGAALQAPGTSGLLIVQFICPPTDAFRAGLAAAGASPLAYLVNNAFVVKADLVAAKKLAALPFVRWVGPYHTAYKCEPTLLEAAGRGPVLVNVQTFERGPAAKAVGRGPDREIRREGGFADPRWVPCSRGAEPGSAPGGAVSAGGAVGRRHRPPPRQTWTLPVPHRARTSSNPRLGTPARASVLRSWTTTCVIPTLTSSRRR